MSQTQALVSALKRALKTHGVRYQDVAHDLQLSMATVKRMFAESNFTLDRLDQVCRLLSMDIADLVKMTEAHRRKLTMLSEQQERELVADPSLLMVAYLVINGYSFADILAHYHFSEPELIHYLVKLDKLKLVELLPKNRIKLLIAPNFSWRKSGPIQRFFVDRLRDEFLQSEFDRPGEVWMVLSGMLSQASVRKLADHARRLEREFRELNETDMHLSLEQREQVSMIVAMRPWRPAVFHKLRRESAGRKTKAI